MLKTGLEQLLTEPDRWLKGRRVGLVAHPASVLPDLTEAAEGLLRADVRLTTLFSAEHGLTGTDDGEVPHKAGGAPCGSIRPAYPGCRLRRLCRTFPQPSFIRECAC